MEHSDWMRSTSTCESNTQNFSDGKRIDLDDHYVFREEINPHAEKNHHANSFGILSLPTEVLHKIFGTCPPLTVKSLSLVCMRFRDILDDAWLWKYLWKKQGWYLDEHTQQNIKHNYERRKWQTMFNRKAWIESNWSNGLFLQRDIILQLPNANTVSLPSHTGFINDHFVVCTPIIAHRHQVMIISHNKSIESCLVPFERRASLYVPHEDSREVWYAVPNQNGGKVCQVWNVATKSVYPVNVGTTAHSMAFDLEKIGLSDSSDRLRIVDVSTEKTRSCWGNNSQNNRISTIQSIRFDPIRKDRLVVHQRNFLELFDSRNSELTHCVTSTSPITGFQTRDHLVAYSSGSSIALFDIRHSFKNPLQVYNYDSEGSYVELFQFDDCKVVASVQTVPSPPSSPTPLSSPPSSPSLSSSSSDFTTIPIFNFRTGEVMTEIPNYLNGNLKHLSFHKDKLLINSENLCRVLYFGGWHELYFPREGCEGGKVGCEDLSDRPSKRRKDL